MHKTIVLALAAFGLLAPNMVAYAQGVGSKVECSPYAMNSQWLPGTVIGTTPGGDLKVRLDPREGYGDNEEYVVQKRWVRGAAAAPVQQQQPFADVNRPTGNNGGGGGGLKIGDIVNASPFALKDQWYPGQIIGFQYGNPIVRLTRPGMDRSEDHLIMPNWVKAAAGAVNNALNGGMPGGMPQLPGGLPDMPQFNAPPIAANPPAFQPPAANRGGPIKVGDRVRFSPEFWKDKSKWKTGIVKAVDGNGNYEVQADAKGPLQNSVWQTVREEFIEKDNSAGPQLAGPGNFPTTNKPIPGHEQGPRPGSDCQPNAARFREILEDHYRYNYGIDHEQVDIAWDSFNFGRSNEAQRKEMGARDMYQVDASFRVKAVRTYEQQGRKYQKTVVYQYVKPVILFWVNDAGNCVFGGVDKSGGKLIYDSTNEISQVEFEAAPRFVYARPAQYGCNCHKS